MAQRVKRGDEVRLRCWDHMEGCDEPHEFYVYGRVQVLGKRSLTVDCWAHIDLNDPERDPSGDNIKTYTLLRKCITEIKVYGQA